MRRARARATTCCGRSCLRKGQRFYSGRAMLKRIRQYGIGLVIVDSIGLAVAGAPEKSEIAIPYMDALARLGVPTLSIAHVTKAEEDKFPFGSIYFHNSARNTWNVKRGQEQDEEANHMGLFHRKSNDDRKSSPWGLRITFEDGGNIIRFNREELVEEFSEELSVSQRIRRASRGRTKPTRELALG